MKHLNNIYTFVFSLFFTLIPFTEHFQAAPNILLGILIAIFPFVVKKEDWKKTNTQAFYILLALVLIVAVGMGVGQRWEDISFLTKIIIVPVILILSFPVKNFRLPLYLFLLSSSGLLLISVVKLGAHYFTYQTLNLDVGAIVNELLMGERPYLGFIYLVSFCLSIYLMQLQKAKWIKILLAILATIFCIFILFISARLSILSLLIILGASVFYAKNKKRTLLISFGGIVAMALAGFLNPNFISRLTAGFEQKELSIQKIIVLEPRSHIWECSAKIAKSEPVMFIGFGFRNTIIQLGECFSTHEKFLSEEHREFFIKSQFNTHNQFINFYLSSGVLSLLVFLLLFCVLIKSNYRSYITFALVLALFLFCIFENVLSRQFGAMMFGVLLSILSMIRKDSKQLINEIN